MIKKLQKYGYWFLGTIVMLFLAVLCMIHADRGSIQFGLSYDSHRTQIPMYEASEGSYYVFLPSHGQVESLEIIMPETMEASLGGRILTNGMPCSGYQLKTSYDLVIDGQHMGELQFYRSANMPTLYLDTATGSMDRIHEDKNYSESASAAFVSPEGTLMHWDPDTTVKGRGNATWTYDKRPYSLTLSSEADLLDMGSGSNWVLLANAADATNLNNKLVMDLANQTGLSWSPEGEFVDVYLNGAYAGLYLLTEKVEVGTSRLDMDVSSGNFLAKVDLDTRWDTLRNPIKTANDRTVEIVAPKKLTEPQKSAIHTAIGEMEQLLSSGADLTDEPSFDLDSWVRRYLIDEICANIDADLASSYFYCTDGTFYAGPIWDYDMAFGNDIRNQNPHAFIAKNTFKSDELISVYYSTLYRNPSFHERMIQIYQAEFLPILSQLLDGGIDELAANIQVAADMNSLRWQSMYQTLVGGNQTVSTVHDLMNYVRTRVSFLNSAWIDSVPYCTVQFESPNGVPYWSLSVKQGTILETTYFDLENSKWVDVDSGEIFDFNQPITSDAIVTQAFW